MLNKDIMSIIISNLSLDDVMSLRCVNKEIRDNIDIRIVKTEHSIFISHRHEGIAIVDVNNTYSIHRFKGDLYNGLSIYRDLNVYQYYTYINGFLAKYISISKTSIEVQENMSKKSALFNGLIDINYVRSIVLNINYNNFREYIDRIKTHLNITTLCVGGGRVCNKYNHLAMIYNEYLEYLGNLIT